MTDSFVTQCPHCQTRFRVNHNQLGMARGAVRCGACKQVFNAARQLLEQSAAQQPAAAVATAAPASPEAPVTSPATEPGQPSNLREWQASQLEALDLDGELARLERRGAGAELSASRDADEEHWPHEPFGNHAGEAQAALSEELESAHDGREEPRFSTDAFEHPGELQALGPGLHGERLQAEHDDEQPSTAARPAPRRVERTEPGFQDIPLLDLEDDPLQLQWQRSRPSWSKRLFWGALSLLAAIALVSQYTYFHFDELARQDQFRPWLQGLCPVLGCKLPSKVDVKQIRSSNLVVRSHPDFAGALVVDAIIYNRAPFSQPFPLLELRFADLNGQLIASRRFKPAEYLAGDLAGQAEMPPQTPIHIALDILDPGPKAVNYSLSFRSPE